MPTPTVVTEITEDLQIAAVQMARRYLSEHPKATAVDAAYYVTAASTNPIQAIKSAMPFAINDLFHLVLEQLTGKKRGNIEYGGAEWKALLNRIAGEASDGFRA